MLRNYFLSSFRNLKKNKGYALLNILGLASGLTCFAFIALWVKDELSYDSNSQNADKIVRIVGKITTASEVFEHAVSSIPMAAALKADFPEVQNTVRMEKEETIAKTGGKQLQQQGI